MANIVRGKAECYILYLSQDSHQELYILYKQSGSALSVLLYFKLTKVSTKYRSLVISTHLLNNKWFSLIKCVNNLAFYNYSSVL